MFLPREVQTQKELVSPPETQQQKLKEHGTEYVEGAMDAEALNGTSLQESEEPYGSAGSTRPVITQGGDWKEAELWSPEEVMPSREVITCLKFRPSKADV